MRRARERAYCSRPTRTLTGLCQPWRATSPSSPSAAAFTCCVEHRLFPSPVRGRGNGGGKGKAHQESGSPEVEDFVELLALFQLPGRMSLGQPGCAWRRCPPLGVPQGGVRHRGGQGAQRPPAAGVQAGFILAYGLRGGEGEPEVPAVSEGSAVRAGLSKYLCPPELPCPAAGSGRTKI